MTRLIMTIVGPYWLRTYGIALGMALLLTFTAANGTDSVPLVVRFPYWLILMVFGTLIAQVTGRMLDRFASLNLWQTIAVMIVITTPLISVMVWLVTATFNSDHALDPSRLVRLVEPVLVITVAMAALHVLVNGTPAQSHAFAPDVQTEPGATFRERLPFKFRHAEIHALEAEDHYLRVHTAAGDTLILMRLYDAIRELDGIEGSQTHRSWWVAKAAVIETVRSNGRVSFMLKDGLSAPVSRGFAKALKLDGWL
ncbi:MAG: LytTR family transcriptional regulator [Asticcacaulis sp.]|nr:LytTR family transcriptional regulator [Asticcacaulis sp.]